MFGIILSLIATLLGLLELYLGEPTLALLFMPLGYLALLLLVGQQTRLHRDPLSALNIVLFVAFLRFSLPALLLPITGDDETLLARAMRLRPQDWQQGHTMALTAMLALALGWSLVGKHHAGAAPVLKRFPGGISAAAIAAMAVGVAALYLFVGFNASVGDAISDGSFRGTEISVGTGPFLYLSFLLISGSVALCAHLLAHRRRSRWMVMAPVIFAGLCYMTLGGRGKAITPMVAGVLLLWMARLARQRASELGIARVLKVGILVLPLLLWLTYFGRLYRGGEGLNAFSKSLSLSGITEYVQEQAMSDVGSLHSVARATALQPGVLGGKTFTSLLWPLNEKLHIPGKSAGVYITESTFAPGQRKWGFNASLAGDAWLNFGPLGVLLAPFLLGTVLKLAYVRCREGRLHAPIYAIGAIYGMWTFSGTVQVWPQALTVLVSSWILIRVAALRERQAGTRTANPARAEAGHPLAGDGELPRPANHGGAALAPPSHGATRTLSSGPRP